MNKKEKKKGQRRITYLVPIFKSEIMKKNSTILSFEHFEKALGNEILKSLISRIFIRYYVIFKEDFI